MSNVTANEDGTVDLEALFLTDKVSEEDGRWVDLSDATKFKIRAFGSKIVLDLRENLMQPFEASMRAGIKLHEAKNEEIGLRVIAGGVIADWAGVKIDGVPVDYSPEAAYTLLKKLPRLAAWILGASGDAQTYKDAAVKDGSKNS